MIGLLLGQHLLTAQAQSPEETGPNQEFTLETVDQITDQQSLLASAGGLLLNGNFEEIPFYFQVPNHWVAGGWHRWWTDTTPTMPEFDDLRPWSPPAFDGIHAQVYFKWGTSYEAGIYQEVSGLTPCVPYRLTMWAHNDSLVGVFPHARIGLDPQGTQLTSREFIGPENEYSIVHGGMPPLTVWSREQSNLFTWEQLVVEAEPVGEKLTAILYAYPEHPDDGRTYYFTTFWDAGQLTVSSFSGDRLPVPQNWTPSGFITDVNIVQDGNSLKVTWRTPSPASSQVWYDIIPPSVPITFTASSVVYLPIIANSNASYAYATTLNTTPTTNHQALIPNLEDGQTVSLLLLSRRPYTEACITEIYGPIKITIVQKLR